MSLSEEKEEVSVAGMRERLTSAVAAMETSERPSVSPSRAERTRRRIGMEPCSIITFRLSEEDGGRRERRGEEIDR